MSLDQFDPVTSVSLVISLILFVLTMELLGTLFREIFWGLHSKESWGMILAWVPVGIYSILFFLSGSWVGYDWRFLLPAVLAHNLIVPYIVWFAGFYLILAIRIFFYHRRSKAVTAIQKQEE